jgi:hypothetical protein
MGGCMCEPEGHDGLTCPGADGRLLCDRSMVKGESAVIPRNPKIVRNPPTDGQGRSVQFDDASTNWKAAYMDYTQCAPASSMLPSNAFKAGWDAACKAAVVQAPRTIQVVGSDGFTLDLLRGGRVALGFKCITLQAAVTMWEQLRTAFSRGGEIKLVFSVDPTRLEVTKEHG